MKGFPVAFISTMCFDGGGFSCSRVKKQLYVVRTASSRSLIHISVFSKSKRTPPPVSVSE